MVYRRYPYISERRRQYYKTSPIETKNYNYDAGIETVKHEDNIPLPNESDASTNEVMDKRTSRSLPIIRFLKNNIKLEEVILLGLIFFLLDEGINDDFLLLILIYILLT